jgi:F0F1-type ATP synthase membrane subunit b/b'
MNDTSETLTADQLEAEADRARERLNATVDELLLNLRPKSLASEWMQSTGLNEMTAGETIELAYRRHPVAITLFGLGLGFLAVAGTRRAAASRSAGRETFAQSVGQSFADLGDTVTGIVRERARQNSERLLKIAEREVAATTERMADAVEHSLEGWLAKIPAPPAAQSLLTCGAQLLLATALQAILRK